ncbi:hypothetical protein [Bradyrhizobium pachyrhizi]|uniref:hypothetical protein n=1 Tax=Bradyrhizobium pachyrhizi TaxID=280333 RepID=UPI003D368321
MTDQHSTHSECVTWYDELAGKSRKALARSWEALKLPKPDTFLGRKIHEPFRESENANNISEGRNLDGVKS